MNQNYGLKLPVRVIKKNTVFSVVVIKSGLFTKKTLKKEERKNLDKEIGYEFALIGEKNLLIHFLKLLW